MIFHPNNLKRAVTELVPELIWAPDFFGPQEIWSPRNLVPRNLVPAPFWSLRNLVPKKFGPREIWSPGNLVPKKFGPQEEWSPKKFAKYERNQIRVKLSEHLYFWLNNTSHRSSQNIEPIEEYF